MDSKNLNTNEIIKDYNNYLAVANIAIKNNCSKWLIYDILKKEKITRERFRYSKQCLERYYHLIKYLSELKLNMIEISKILTVKLDLVKKIYKDYGINKNVTKKRIGDKDKRLIEELYLSGKSATYIQKELNISNTPVLNLLKSKNLIRDNHKYTIKDGFLSNGIDSPELAWLFGIYLTDGNCYKGRVSLSMTDLDVIVKIKNIMGYTGPIRTTNYTKTKDLHNLVITKKSLYEKFIELGCIPNKSHFLKFPKIPNELLPDFIRGAFDGDGSICRKISITGNRDFINGIKKAIIDNLGFCGDDFRINIRASKSPNIITITIRNKIQAKKFVDWIYKGSNEDTRMNRKYDSYVKKWTLGV